MARWLYWIAAALALGAALIHELLGAPLVLPPLADAGLPAEVLWLHRFSWHAGTVATVAMAYLYQRSARHPGNPAMAGVATAMAAGFALIALSLAIWGNPVMWSTPAPYLWPALALTGALAAWQDRR